MHGSSPRSVEACGVPVIKTPEERLRTQNSSHSPGDHPCEVQIALSLTFHYARKQENVPLRFRLRGSRPVQLAMIKKLRVYPTTGSKPGDCGPSSTLLETPFTRK